MKAIEEQIRLMIAQRDALTHKIEGAQMALRLMKGEAVPIEEPAAPSGRQRRGNVKEAVLDLLTTAGESGLTAQECVAQAKDRLGLDLDRASVSSLLSRLKKDDVLFYDGAKYRLKKYAGPRQAA